MHLKGETMNGFPSGVITGGLVGVIGTLLMLVIVAGSQNKEKDTTGQSLPSHGKIFLAALTLLAISGGCFAFNLEKSALVSLLLSVLMIAKLGGSKLGIAVAGIAAAMLAWFLPPNGTLLVSWFDNQLTLVLFILGAIVGSILMEGKQWIRRLVAMANPD